MYQSFSSVFPALTEAVAVEIGQEILAGDTEEGKGTSERGHVGLDVELERRVKQR